MTNLDNQILKRLKGLLVKRPGLALGLWGEAGIGKTHTTQNVLHEMPCKNLSQHATTSLANLARALPKPKKLAVWATKILEKLENNEVLTVEQTTSALGVTLSGIAPFILHLEDVHEANPEQLEWIVALAKVVTRLKGVALIVTSRSEPPEPFEALRLEKLDFEAVKNLLENEAEALLPTEAMTWIYGRAAGNPLFSVEFFRFLARQGFVWSDGKQWRWRKPEFEVMPVTVEALLEQTLKFTANTPELEAVLGAKAVLGLDCTQELWAEVARLEALDFQKAKRVLERNGVLFQSEFVHPLYREMTFKNISKTRLIELARAAIKALQDTPEKTHQLIEMANLEPIQALSILTSAALRLETRGDVVAAAHIRVQALDYATGETRNQLSLEAARGLSNSSDSQQVFALLEELALSLNVEVKNKALELMAKCHSKAGQRAAMYVAIERLPTDYRNGLAWFSKYIDILFGSGDFDAVIKHWEQHPEHHGTSQGVTIYYVGYAQIEQGNLEVAQTLATTFLKRPNLIPEDQIQGLDILATIAFYRGDYQQADLLFTQLLNINNRQNIRDHSNYLRNRAVNRLQLGQYEQSLPDFEESIQLDFERGMPVICAQTKVMMSPVYLETGRFKQAEQVLLEALEVLKPIPAQAFLVYGLVGLALLYLRWQSAHGALLAHKYALEALRIAQDLQTPVLQANAYLCCSEVQTQTGNPLLGLEYAEQSLALSKQIGFSETIMNAHLARAGALYELGRNTQALEDLQIAQSICLETGLVLELQKTLLEMDRLNNDPNGASQRLEWFEARGFSLAANTAQKYFPELNPSTAPTSSNPATTFIPYLEVLGSMQITQVGQPTPVRGRKRQELLALLLEARISGRGEVSKLELADKLYPDTDEIQANAGIYDVVYQLRSSLGENTLTTTTNGYALGNLKTDVETFLETGNTQLWRGVYLEGLLLEGSDTVRESLYLALRTRAEVLLETDPVEVARVGRLLCEADPYDLEGLRLTVAGLRAGQNHRSLLRFYDTARTRFLEIGEVLPATWQDFLSSIGTTA